MGWRAEFVAHERDAIGDDLAARGPDQPTLCEGWRTRDLLRHLIIRESHTWRTLIGGRQAKRAADAHVHALNWPSLIQEFRAGPPPGSPLRIPGANAVANFEEFFVHHEDIRRAAPDWSRRELPPAVEEAFWRRMRSPFGRIMVRRVDVGVHIRRPNGEHTTLRAARPGVILTGEPSEILLYLFGRRSAAQVRLDGPAEARERLGRAKLGF